jgi:hypothetical protein
MKAHALVRVVLGLAAGLGLAGCAYEDPATGAKATYALEALHSEVDAPVPVVYAAALKAADSLDLTVGRAVESGFGAEIRAVDVLANVVNVRLKVLPGERTRLTIAVGAFGSRRKSIMVFNSIMANLAGMQPAASVSSIQWGAPE